VDQATGTAYVGGRFTHADTVTTSGVATLTGEGFGSLGGFAYNGDPQFATIIALAHAGGRVYAAGCSPRRATWPPTTGPSTTAAAGARRRPSTAT
jgi:hypothetical protein